MIQVENNVKFIFLRPQKPSAHAMKISVLPFCYIQQEWNGDKYIADILFKVA